MNTLTKFGIAAAAVITASAGAALAQDVAAAIEARQANFEQMDEHWKPMLPMMRGRADPAAVAAAAEAIKPLAEQIPALFEVDTRGSGIENEALDRIWLGKDDFDMKNAALMTALDNMATAAAGGDDRAIKAAIREVGLACGNCHDIYRAD